MKNNKWYVISTFVLGCIVINFAGRILSDRLQLPLWLDSFGTVTAAYVLGPFCGAMVGMTVNLTYGILYSWTNMFYAVVSAMVGITIGICVKKGFLKNLYGVLSTSFLVAVLSVTLSVPLNYLYCDGSTQNIWGDGVIESMEKVGFNSFFSHCMGQFYLDFLDKVITIVLVFSLIKLVQKKIVSKRQHTLLMMFLCILVLGMIRGETVTAKTVTEALYHREVLLMQITGANDVDIMLDEDGQPVSDGNGDTALVSDDECWLQDIKNEAMTEEGELFYEDEEGDASYGWSLLDFMQGEYDDFTQMEIQQRIRSKMSKRDYIDAGSIQTTVNFDGHIYHIRIAFRRTDSNSEYNIDIESNGVEVIVE